MFLKEPEWEAINQPHTPWREGIIHCEDTCGHQFMETGDSPHASSAKAAKQLISQTSLPGKLSILHFGEIVGKPLLEQFRLNGPLETLS